MYSPHDIYIFLTSPDLKGIIGKSFYKRHMESASIQSPFDTPEEIFMLEYLIAHGYIIAEYRNNESNDSESYLISTMGHAFVENYRKSISFRFKSWVHYSKTLYWILFGSALGSTLSTFILRFFD